MAQLLPYLHFNGNCSDAMKFYKEILGGDLDLQTVGESQTASFMPPETHKNVMHSTLKTDKFTIMASDMMEGQEINGNRITLCLICDKNEIKSLFDKLMAGGKVMQELKEEFFGTFGSGVDKFGINWMFQSDK